MEAFYFIAVNFVADTDGCSIYNLAASLLDDVCGYA